MDREKVIKGLECCKWSDAGRYDGYEPVYENCENCPYNNEEELKSECCEKLIRDALELLKEQEAEIRQLRLALDIAKGTCNGIQVEGR